MGTFGAASQGLVLNNYATSDAYAAVKVGVKSVAPSLNDRAVVGLPLALITSIALLVDDVGIVVSLTGSLMGSAVIYMLPGLMLLKGDKVAKASWEKKVAPLGMLGLGIVSAI